jgi:hypothetical protein
MGGHMCYANRAIATNESRNQIIYVNVFYSTYVMNSKLQKREKK